MDTFVTKPIRWQNLLEVRAMVGVLGLGLGFGSHEFLMQPALDLKPNPYKTTLPVTLRRCR